MAGPLIAVGNEIKAATTITASGGTATGYALAALFDAALDALWRANVTGGPQFLTFDFGSNISPNLAALHNHNFPTSLQATWQADANNDGLFTTTTDFGPATIRADGEDLFVYDVTMPTVRYWRWRFDNVGSIAPQVGEAMVGQAQQLPHGFRAAFVEGPEAFVDVHATAAGVEWTVQRHTKVRERFALTQRSQSDADFALLRSLFGTTVGPAAPFFFAPFPDSTNADRAAQCHFVRLEQTEMQQQHAGPQDRSTPITLHELVKDFG